MAVPGLEGPSIFSVNAGRILRELDRNKRIIEKLEQLSNHFTFSTYLYKVKFNTCT